jgi:glycosyltransferase involved in cell wall biosynthesis
LKILEAQASGAVVVASARGDIPSMLSYGSHGIPVYEETLDHWVDTIDMLLNNPKCRNLIAQNSQEFIQQKYTWANSAQALHELVIGLCDEIPQ